MIRVAPEDVDIVSRALAEDIVLQNDAYKSRCLKDVK